MTPFRIKVEWVTLLIVYNLMYISTGLVLDNDDSLVVGAERSPQEDDDSSIVGVMTEPSPPEKVKREETDGTVAAAAHIDQILVTSVVTNRFACTTVRSKVQNFALIPQKAIFSVVLPETALVSGFVMEIGNKNYTAYVKEKDEAKKIFEQAVATGQTAAHVSVNARDSNRFTVSINLEPEQKGAFYLFYEELLKRQDNHYELVINLHPGQPVKDLSVEVTIRESKSIENLKVPSLRTGTEIDNQKKELQPNVDIKFHDLRTATVTFSPDIDRQKHLAKHLGTEAENGLSGQFIVQYDVARDNLGGELVVDRDYFVHFYAPSKFDPLPKLIVFVVDTSASMKGQKIMQLQESLNNILEQLNEQDLFQLIEFNSIVRVLDIHDLPESVKYPNSYMLGYENENQYPPLHSIEFKEPSLALQVNIEKAKLAVGNLTVKGNTDVYTALEVALHLVELTKSQEVSHQPLIIFLTDGEPNVRVETPNEIITKISKYNTGVRKAPIYTLAFGNNANRQFLQNLALQNNGFGRQIYEAADASLQLESFYKSISTPLLANVVFKYPPTTTNITDSKFPLFFAGSELVVTGRYVSFEDIIPTVEAQSTTGTISKMGSEIRAVDEVQRIWAYLTVKQLLEKRKYLDSDAEELKKKALTLALKYQFVTPVSSLIVVKPTTTTAVNTEPADVDIGGGYGLGDAGGSSGISKPVSFFPTGQASRFTPGRAPFESTIPEMFVKLTWLKDLLNNGYISLPLGKFKLGFYEEATEAIYCNNAPPQKQEGNCTLIGGCSKIFPLLVSKDAYEKHFCLLNKYAGVCCPK